jgi:hypothetical protein
MIKLGEMQELEVSKIVNIGAYLQSEDKEKTEDRVLLPIKQVPAGTKVGDKINVFIYRDSDDKIIATVKKPKITLGEIASLKVVEMSRIGAFLNWGLEKDLFLPFKEQIGDIRLNGEYMVGLYIDKSDRLCQLSYFFLFLILDFFTLDCCLASSESISMPFLVIIIKLLFIKRPAAFLKELLLMPKIFLISSGLLSSFKGNEPLFLISAFRILSPSLSI